MISWKRVKIRVGGKAISARVADNLLKRAIGFMFYSREERDAIIFKGGGEFWMLFVPQDIQLLEVKDGKVSRVVQMKANTTNRHRVNGDYAIELVNFPPIKEGEKVELPGDLF